MTKSQEMNRGVIVAVVLAILTAAEYFIAVNLQLPLVLIIIAIIKAGMVLQWYMHLPRVLGGGEGGH